MSDPDRSVRFQTWGAVRALGLKKAYPALKAQLARETSGFAGFATRMLQETLDSLEDEETKAAAGPASQVQTIAELNRQAVELEKKAKELKTKIESLKIKAEQEGGTASSTAAGTSP